MTSGVYVRKFGVAYGMTGRRHSRATRLKIKSTHVGMLGQHQTEETRKKIGTANSLALKGRSIKLFHKKKCICSFCKASRGEKCWDEKKRIRNFVAALRNRPIEQKMRHWDKLSGINHYNWQGGKSFEPYPLGWNHTFKEQIRYRDGYQCQLCGVPEIECTRRLHVHHIDYDKKNLAVLNLLSLCISCHMKTNYNRKKWTEILSALLLNK